MVVDPSPILLTSDTLSFNITIDPGAHKISKGDKIVFKLYIQHDGTTEQISIIELLNSSPVTKQIAHKIDPKNEIEQVKSIFQIYKGDKLSVKSPILPIANIEDLR